VRYPLEQDNDDGHLGKDSGVFYTPDFGFSEDGEVVFCGGIGPLSSRSERLEFAIPVGATNNFGDESGELSDRDMLGEAMVVDPVGATFCIFNELRVF